MTPPNSLIKYGFYNRQGREIARVNTIGEGRVTILDSSLTPRDIAEALQSVKDALIADRVTDYNAFGLFHQCPPDEVRRKNIPDAQVVKKYGQPVVDEQGNIWVISGHFEYPNVQLDAQRPAS